MKIHNALALAATVLVPLFFLSEVKAQTNDDLPTLRGQGAIEKLKQTAQYDSLMDAARTARQDNGQASGENSAAVLGQSAKLLASDPARDDLVGFSVAISGDTVIIGGYGEDTPPNTFNGAAYIFVKSGATWSQQAKLVASDAASNDWFGFSVAISGDTAIVGAFQEDTDFRFDNGAAYVFVRNGTTWTQQAKLLASDAASFENFGYSLAIWGDTAIVGAVVESTAPNISNGAAYVFVRSGTIWTEQTKLLASDATSSDGFGSSVAILGNTAIIGATGDDTATTTNNGAAYVFVRSETTWTEQAKLFASDPATDDRFGTSVAISVDAVIVGVPAKDIGTTLNPGAAYIFTRSETTWTEQAKLVASDAASDDQFGVSVAISGDTAIVGSYQEDTFPIFGNGAAYVFRRGGTFWSQQTKLLASDAAHGETFGQGVAISGDTVVIGAPTESTEPNVANGAAYVFRFVWSPFDYDGDGKADVSVFRPSTGGWFISQSSNNAFFGVTFGQNGDVIAPADFDGDNKTDISVFRNGTWFRLNSSNGAFAAVTFGTTGDIPVPGDFDGDGKADVSVYRPSAGSWYRLNSSNGSFTGVGFGIAEDKPQMADFDGDGKADIAVFRPSNGTWYWLNSSNGAFGAVNFGISTDLTVPADFDGDGKTDVSVYRPSTGSWYRLNSSNGSFAGVAFGISTDRPAAADYDGDGKADVGVFRPTEGTWYLLRSTSGFGAQAFGTNGDVPTPSAFVR